MRYWIYRKTPYFWLWVVRHLPYRLRYWAYIQCVSEATTGVYSDTAVSKLRAMDVLSRIDALHR